MRIVGRESVVRSLTLVVGSKVRAMGFDGAVDGVVFARTKMHFSLAVMPPPDECCPTAGESVVVVCFPLDQRQPESAAAIAAVKGNQNYQSSLS